MSQTIDMTFQAVVPKIGISLGRNGNVLQSISLQPPAKQILMMQWSDRGTQGPIGPTGSSYTSQNKDSINLNAGTPVTEDVSGSGFVRADASANGKYCVGLLQGAVNQNVSGLVQTSGILILADWTSIAGTATLTAKAKYYLDVVSGKITTNAPSVPGQICQRIGVAVDSLTLSINILQAILL